MDTLQLESAIQKYSAAVANQTTLIDTLNSQKQQLLDRHESIRTASGYSSSSNYLNRHFERFGLKQVDRPQELNDIDQQLNEVNSKLQAETQRLVGLQADLQNYQTQLNREQQAFDPNTPAARVLAKNNQRFAPK